MKKKLLTILLSFAMVMTMIPFASITAFADEIETVGDVLATVSDFPTTEDWHNTPDNAWINEQNTALFIENDSKMFYGNCSIELSTGVVKSEENYVAYSNICIFTFIMDEGVLKNIIIASESTDYHTQVGTYGPNTNPAPDKGDLLKKIVKGAAIVAGAAAVVGVVGTVVKNVQKAAVAQQKAYQTKMQQQMVQKQVDSIKTVLKGAGVVLSLANFGSSLGKLFQLNQFGFNQFGFR